MADEDAVDTLNATIVEKTRGNMEEQDPSLKACSVTVRSFSPGSLVAGERPNPHQTSIALALSYHLFLSL